MTTGTPRKMSIGSTGALSKLTGWEEGFIPACLEHEKGSGDKSLFPTIIVLTAAKGRIVRIVRIESEGPVI